MWCTVNVQLYLIIMENVQWKASEGVRTVISCVSLTTSKKVTTGNATVLQL
jgi:hypothetical protein